jgi:hypothetical protein
MSSRFHNANEALAFLQGKGIDTSAGRVFLASDVEEAVKLSFEDRVAAVDAPRPKTMAQAKRMVRQDEDLMTQLQSGGQRDSEIAGHSISAGPDPLSRA